MAAALADLQEQALHCRNCPLWADATQTVFGEGPAEAQVMFVGEAPGDQEDRQGRPFVGPAGQLFDRALEEAGIDRREIYLTNAVKHFKFMLRGKRRIHQKPDAGEIAACKPWLFSEIELVQPRLIVAMGATAAQALIGRTVTIGRERGRFQHYPPNRHLFVTVHPSFLLRVPDERAKAVEYQRFVSELQMIAEGPPEPAKEPIATEPAAAPAVTTEPAEEPAASKAEEAPAAPERRPRRGRKADGGSGGQYSLF
jgi:DNA polymerase